MYTEFILEKKKKKTYSKPFDHWTKECVSLFSFTKSLLDTVIFLVFVIRRSPLCLEVTVFTLEDLITVLRYHVMIKMTLLGSLMIALITRIPNTFMYRSNMSLEMTLVCCSIITLITRILDTFMHRLNMSQKITLLCSMKITPITRIHDTFMFRLNMLLKIILCFSLIITLITRIQNNGMNWC